MQAVLSTKFKDFQLGDPRRRAFFPLLGNGIFTVRNFSNILSPVHQNVIVWHVSGNNVPGNNASQVSYYFGRGPKKQF